MDRFKQYIEENAGKLGQDTPPLEIWGRIQEQIKPADKKAFAFHWMHYAAACILVLVVGVVYFTAYNPLVKQAPMVVNTVNPKDSLLQKSGTELRDEKELASVTKEMPGKKAGLPVQNTMDHQKQRQTADNVSSAANETTTVADVEKSFVTLISLQKEKVCNTPVFAENQAYFNDFYRQLHQMEEDEKDLRKEITREGLSNQLLSQLINIYQQKLSVLEKLQKEINKTNTCYKQNKQPNAVQQNYFLHL